MTNLTVTCFSCDTFLEFDPKETVWTCPSCELHYAIGDIEIAAIPRYTDENLQSALYHCENGWVALRRHYSYSAKTHQEIPPRPTEELIPTYIGFLFFHIFFTVGFGNIFSKLFKAFDWAWAIPQLGLLCGWFILISGYRVSRKYHKERDLFLKRRRYLLAEMRRRNLRPDPRIPFPSMS
ncbi:MAG: hypothetical protein AAFO96_04845 [Bacteroidota bacterium]